jgi:hypothetical protein
MEKLKGIKENCYHLRLMKDRTHKVHWNNQYGKNIVSISPKNYLYGRLILDISNIKDIKILCNDFPMTTININQRLFTHNAFKGIHIYDGHIIRLYHDGNEWVYATDNCMNSEMAYYKTNKNKNVVNIDESFHDIIDPLFDKKEIEKKDIRYTYFYIVSLTKIHKLYCPSNDSIMYLGKMSNRSDIEKFESSNNKEVNFNKIGTLYERGDIWEFRYTEDACIRNSIISNLPNVKAIAIWNSTSKNKIDLFKKIYPYWSKYIDEIENQKETLAEKACRFYHRTHKMRYKVTRRDFDNSIFFAWSNWAHKIYLETKKVITPKHMLHIINQSNPAYLTIVLKIWV